MILKHDFKNVFIIQFKNNSLPKYKEQKDKTQVIRKNSKKYIYIISHKNRADNIYLYRVKSEKKNVFGIICFTSLQSFKAGENAPFCFLLEFSANDKNC